MTMQMPEILFHLNWPFEISIYEIMALSWLQNVSENECLEDKKILFPGKRGGGNSEIEIHGFSVFRVWKIGADVWEHKEFSVIDIKS